MSALQLETVATAAALALALLQIVKTFLEVVALLAKRRRRRAVGHANARAARHGRAVVKARALALVEVERRPAGNGRAAWSTPRPCNLRPRACH